MSSTTLSAAPTAAVKELNTSPSICSVVVTLGQPLVQRAGMFLDVTKYERKTTWYKAHYNGAMAQRQVVFMRVVLLLSTLGFVRTAVLMLLPAK